MSSDNPHAPMGWPERVNAFWSCTTTLAFMKAESGQRILHQLWIDDLGLTQWRPVPLIDPNDKPARNPAVVGVLPDEAA